MGYTIKTNSNTADYEWVTDSHTSSATTLNTYLTSSGGYTTSGGGYVTGTSGQLLTWSGQTIEWNDAEFVYQRSDHTHDPDLFVVPTHMFVPHEDQALFCVECGDGNVWRNSVLDHAPVIEEEPEADDWRDWLAS